MTNYLLDTNIISHLVKQHPAVVKKVVNTDMNSLVISTMTEAEILYGLAKRPKAVKLRKAVEELLLRVNIIIWDSDSSKYYADVRVRLEAQGKSLAPFDVMIASHALETNMTLVTNDKAFNHVLGLLVEDWTI